MNLKRKLKELKEEQEKEYSKKQYQIQAIVRKPLNSDIVFIMKGDAVVVFDNIESDRFSKLNLFKRISQCRYSRENRYLEIEMTNTVEGMSEFRHVIKMLKNQPSQYMYEFGEVLEKHQTFVDKQTKIAEFMKADPNFEVFKESLMKNSQTFEDKMKEIIRDMEARGQLRFYSYKIIKLNTDNFMYEVRKYFISELFLALMGLNVEQAQSFIMRKGIFDSSNVSKMCQHVKLFLKISNDRMQSISMETSLRTFDGIVIQVKMNYIIYYAADIIDTPSNLLDRTEFCTIVNFEVSETMLEQVMQLRKNSTFNFENYENEQDWDYSEEVEKFLSAYYDQSVGGRKKKQTESYSNANLNSSQQQPSSDIFSESFGFFS